MSSLTNKRYYYLLISPLLLVMILQSACAAGGRGTFKSRMSMESASDSAEMSESEPTLYDAMEMLDQHDANLERSVVEPENHSPESVAYKVGGHLPPDFPMEEFASEGEEPLDLSTVVAEMRITGVPDTLSNEWDDERSATYDLIDEEVDLDEMIRTEFPEPDDDPEFDAETESSLEHSVALQMKTWGVTPEINQDPFSFLPEHWPDDIGIHPRGYVANGRGTLLDGIHVVVLIPADQATPMGVQSYYCDILADWESLRVREIPSTSNDQTEPTLMIIADNPPEHIDITTGPAHKGMLEGFENETYWLRTVGTDPVWLRITYIIRIESDEE